MEALDPMRVLVQRERQSRGSVISKGVLGLKGVLMSSKEISHF